jgi:hypothetical protein
MAHAQKKIPPFARACGAASKRPATEVTPGESQTALHYVNNRELRFRADSPGCRLLVDQLMDFPLAEHDDGPDAPEMCVRLPVEIKRLR